jgi:hypothetical protein
MASPDRPAKRAKSEPSESGCSQLLGWVQAGGGTVGKVDVRAEHGLGRGLYATGDLK